MAFEAAKYKNSVLVPLAKDKARLEVLQQVIRDVRGAGGLSAAARLNTAELFAVGPGMSAPELVSHLKSLEMTYNKQKNLPSAQLLKKLLDLFGKDKAGDPGFWAGLAASRGQALKGQLDDFAKAVAEEHPLRVVTPEQAAELANGMGLSGLPEADLTAALAAQGVEVRPDFDIPKIPLPPAIRKVTEFPEFRTIVDVILRPEQPSDMAVIEELTFGSPARRLEPADVTAAKQRLMHYEFPGEEHARQAAQNALGVLSAFESASDIHALTLAAIADATEDLLRRGLPRVAVRAELIKRGVQKIDASRLVAKLSAPREGQAHGASGSGAPRELVDLHRELVVLTRRVAEMVEAWPRRQASEKASAEVPDLPEGHRQSRLEVHNVLSRALGIRVIGSDGRERVRHLLHANDALPAESTWTMQTTAQHQSTISVAVYEQGGERESENPEDNDFLHEKTFYIPPLPAGAEVELSLSVSLDGVHRLSARDPVSGHVSSVDAQVSVLSEEVERHRIAPDAGEPVTARRQDRESIFGVHLGASHASIARMNDLGQAEVVLDLDGNPTTPAVVYFESEKSAVVGAEAKRVQLSDPDNACSFIRRHMGTVYPQEFRGQEYTPESISALILKELVKAANSELGEEVSKVVITVPAYFGIQEKEATKQAGQIAGLEVVEIVTEPVACLLSVGISEERETVLIFDLGGATFDVTVLRTFRSDVEIVAIEGSNTLGGADWDEALAQLIADKFVAQAGLSDDDPRLDAEFEIELLSQAEDTKRSLTKRENAAVRCRYQDKDEHVAVNRAEFEAATRHLVAQTLEISQRVVSAAEAKVPGLKIDRVLLVGGSSKMPMIDAALREQLGWNPVHTDYDLAAAQGAAIYGAGQLQYGSSRVCSCCEEFFGKGGGE